MGSVEPHSRKIHQAPPTNTKEVPVLKSSFCYAHFYRAVCHWVSSSRACGFRSSPCPHWLSETLSSSCGLSSERQDPAGAKGSRGENTTQPCSDHSQRLSEETEHPLESQHPSARTLIPCFEHTTITGSPHCLEF